MRAGYVKDLTSQLQLDGSGRSFSSALEAACSGDAPDLVLLCQLVRVAMFLCAHSVQVMRSYCELI